MRAVVMSVALTALSVAGCSSTQVGPIRPITIADDVAYARPLAEPDLSTFYGASPSMQAAVRNQIVTARMYIADVEYHYYEARLTREVQEEGLGATLATLGLTTASTLVGSAGTKTILSGAATAVVGADKAYNEKELLSNTIQALQTQMRADRKTQAAVIYAKMFKDAGNNTKTITPIVEYTLPMALSDADGYYQAGTIASALIGLSKTVANAEQNADQAKSQAGPNPGAVSDAQGTAAPISDSMMSPANMNVVSGPSSSGQNVVANRGAQSGAVRNVGSGTSSQQNPGRNVSGNPGGQQPGGDSSALQQARAAHQACLSASNDPRLDACQRLPATPTSSQQKLCVFIKVNRNNSCNAESSFEGALPSMASKLPANIGLADVISGAGQNFEDARKNVIAGLPPS
jgi:hypothetical protein